jgi:hypothetical protein
VGNGHLIHAPLLLAISAVISGSIIKSVRPQVHGAYYLGAKNLVAGLLSFILRLLTISQTNTARGKSAASKYVLHEDIEFPERIESLLMTSPAWGTLDVLGADGQVRVEGKPEQDCHCGHQGRTGRDLNQAASSLQSASSN